MRRDRGLLVRPQMRVVELTFPQVAGQWGGDADQPHGVIEKADDSVQAVLAFDIDAAQDLVSGAVALDPGDVGCQCRGIERRRQRLYQ